MGILNPRIGKLARSILKSTNSGFQSSEMRMEKLAEGMAERLKGFKSAHQDAILSKIETDLADPASQLYKDMQEKALEHLDTDTLATELFKQAESVAPQRSWMARHKIATGLGALGAGGLAYHAFGGSGTPLPYGGMSAEEAGTQAAIRDTMIAGAIPGSQISGAQYDGRMMPGQQVALG